MAFLTDLKEKTQDLSSRAWTRIVPAGLRDMAERHAHHAPKIMTGFVAAVALLAVITVAVSVTRAPAAVSDGSGQSLLHQDNLTLAKNYTTPLDAQNSLTDLSQLAQSAALIAPQSFRQMTPDQAVAVNASIAFSTLPNPAAQPFSMKTALPEDRVQAQGCLAMAIYYEAATQSDDGQAAVAQVVLNRVRHPLFPKSICGVVFQGSGQPTGCQFTFTCDGSLGRRPSAAGWKKANEIAARALNGYVMKQVGEATHYHTQWVVPYWQPTLVKLTQIGAHIFYRWMGDAGTPAAFQGQYAGLEVAPALMNQTNDQANQVMVAASATTAAKPAAAVVEPVDLKPAVTQADSEPLVATVEAPKVVVAAATQTVTIEGARRADHNMRLPVPGNW